MAYDNNNIFARILRGEIPSHRVHEDAHTIAFMDVMPQSDGHTLIVPKVAAENIFELPAADLHAAIDTTQLIARAARQAFNADGITLMQFNGAVAGQTVFHIHFHVIPRYAGKSLHLHGREMADPAVLAQHAAQLQQALAALR